MSDDPDTTDTNHEEGSDAALKVETAVLVIGVVATLILFGYVGLHALQTPDGANPQGRVVGTTESSAELLTTVELSNPGDIGLASVTLEVTCGEQTRELQFRHVPADGTRRGTVRCPAGTDPSVTVDSWISV
jgi:hypothetical protein